MNMSTKEPLVFNVTLGDSGEEKDLHKSVNFNQKQSIDFLGSNPDDTMMLLPPLT